MTGSALMTATAGGGRAPRRADPLRQRGRTVLVVLVGLTAVAGLAGGGFIATRAGDAQGAGLSVLYALIPLPLLWLMYWWLDRYEPEPRHYKVAAFVWGGVVAVAISLVLEIWIGDTLDLTDEQLASFVAGPVEESAKGLFLLVTFLRVRHVIDGYVDGLIFAGIVGVGFAFVENIGYYAASYLGSTDLKLAGADGATTTFVVRGIFSPLAHPLFTSGIGIAIGLAVVLRSRVLKVLTVFGGWCASVLMHCLWNSSASFGGGAGFVLVYLGLAALLAGLVVLTVIVRSRQVRTLERSLSYVADRGWIHPAEIPYLSRFVYRRQARSYARAHGGRQTARAVARYQRLATEMAFLHDAVMTGRPKPRGVERTYALLDAMNDVRGDLLLPPAMPPRMPRHL